MYDPKGGAAVIGSIDPITVAFDVSQSWKWPVYKTTNVITVRLQASCGYSCEIGEEYLVYAETRGAGSRNWTVIIGAVVLGIAVTGAVAYKLLASPKMAAYRNS